MESMIIHNLLPIIISILGIYAGGYILLNIKKIRNDKILRVFFYILGLTYLYMGIVYLLVLLGLVEAIPATQASILMRPVNILVIATPFIITKRMGL
jgi:ABC-type transport system involved in multi-copper enzyme maturation permease subunit